MNVKKLTAMWQQKKNPDLNPIILKPSTLQTKSVTNNTFIHQPVIKQTKELVIKQTESLQNVQKISSKVKADEHQTNTKTQADKSNQKIDVKSLKSKFELLHIPMGASRMPSTYSNSNIKQIKSVSDLNQIQQGNEHLSEPSNHKQQVMQNKNQKNQIVEKTKQMTFKQKRQLAQRLYANKKLPVNRLSNDSNNQKVRSPFAQIQATQYSIHNNILTHQIQGIQYNSQRGIQFQDHLTQQGRNENQSTEKITLDIKKLRNKKSIRETDFDDL